MAEVLLRRTLKTQPTKVNKINQSNPITRNLVLAATPYGDKFYCAAQNLFIGGNISAAVHDRYQALKTDNVSGAYAGDFELGADATLMTICRSPNVNANPTYGEYPCGNGYADASSMQFGLRIKTAFLGVYIGTYHVNASSVGLASNRWYNLCAAKSKAGTTQSGLMYINGIPVSTFSTTSSTTKQPFAIGNFTVGADAYNIAFPGDIAAVFVWTRRLSSEEVLRVYENPWQLFTERNLPLLAPSEVKPQFFLPRTTTKQLPNRKKLSKSNPIAKGVVKAFVGVGTDLIDALTGIACTKVGASHKIGSTDKGPGVTLKSNTDSEWTFSTDVLAGSSSIGWVGQFHAGANGVVLRDHTVSDGDIFVWNNAGGWASRFGFGGAPYTVGPTGTIANDTTYSTVTVGNGSTGSLYVDGKFIHSGTVYSPSVGYSLPWHLGVNGLNAQYSDSTTLLIVVWNRPLSEAEAKSFSSNPWQIFETQPKAIVPPSQEVIPAETLVPTLVFPQKSNKQPVTDKDIDFNNSITKGLEFLWDARYKDRDLVKGKKYDALGGSSGANMPDTYSGQIGVCMRNNKTWSHLRWSAANYKASTDYTVFAYVLDDSGRGNYRNPFDSDKPESSARVFQLRFTTANVAEFITFKGVNPYILTGTTSSSSTKPILIIAKSSGIRQTVWLDGKLEAVADSGTMDSIGKSSAEFCVGQYAQSNFDIQKFSGQIYLCGYYSRALSDAEIVSLSENPWQLFKSQPRTLVSRTPVPTVLKHTRIANSQPAKARLSTKFKPSQDALIFNAAEYRDIVTGKEPTTKSLQREATQYGVVVKNTYNSGNKLSFTNRKVSGNQVTFALELRAVYLYVEGGDLLSTCDTNSGYRLGWFSGGFHLTKGTVIYLGGIGVTGVTDPTWYRVICSSDSVSGNWYIYAKNLQTGVVNSVSGVDTNTPAAGQTTWCVNGGADASVQANISIAYIDTVFKPYQEMSWFLDNPWQIFETAPRLLRVPSVIVGTPQLLVPVSDITKGTWTASSGTDLYAMVDEVTPSSTDYIYTTSPSYCEVKLDVGIDPLVSTGHILNYQLLEGSGTVTISLKQGATTIASWSHTLTSSIQDISQTLNSTQADSITDYSDLRVACETP